VSGLVALGAVAAAVLAVVDAVNAPLKRNRQGVGPGVFVNNNVNNQGGNFGNQGFFDPFGDKGPEAEAAKKENWLPYLPQKADEALEPAVSLAPAQAKGFLAKGPLPADMPPATVQKVKRATVYLRVERPDGGIGTGSGFFALEPGIVVTNAHVVGMLEARERPPKHIDVVVNSGEPDEKKLTGTVLGVDRAADLAVLRVPQAPFLPPPLKVQSAATLSLVQKVYIFGFPFGEEMSKQITVTTSSVSQLRKDRFGNIDRVQVNGGMHSGNSGGPVADARGDVVAVSVSMIAFTAINFAVPGDFVWSAIHGRVHAARAGYPVQDGKQVKMSYELTLLDPLQKIRGAKVEYWYGPPGPARPQTRVKPAALPGDGSRRALDLPCKDGKARGDLVLPPPQAGKILFTQPLLITAQGEAVWAMAKPHLPQATLERKPALLAARNEVANRKLRLDAHLHLNDLGKSGSLVEADVAEDLRPDGQGAVAGLRYNRVRAGGGMWQLDARRSRAARAMKGGASVFILDAAGEPSQPRQEFSKESNNASFMGETVQLQTELAQAFRLASIPLPNRQLNPGDTWKTQRTVSLSTAVPEQATLDIGCIYEGTRQRGGRAEAVITVAGTARTAAEQDHRVEGTVHGQAIFDLATGQFTTARIEANLVMDLSVGPIGGPFGAGAGAERVSTPVHVLAQISRRFGSMPAVSREIFRKKDKIAATDPKDLVQPGHRKVFNVAMKAGKTYIIDMKAPETPGGRLPRFDPYLRLEDPKGVHLDEDDDSGGGLNSQILFHAVADGDYRIISTTFGPEQTGDFTLTVREGGK
jgi:S1-C subfamily serine protease